MGLRGIQGCHLLRRTVQRRRYFVNDTHAQLDHAASAGRALLVLVTGCMPGGGGCWGWRRRWSSNSITIICAFDMSRFSNACTHPCECEHRSWCRLVRRCTASPALVERWAAPGRPRPVRRRTHACRGDRAEHAATADRNRCENVCENCSVGALIISSELNAHSGLCITPLCTSDVSWNKRIAWV